MSRQGGKLKPLKAPKKQQKEETEDDSAIREKAKKDIQELNAAKKRAENGRLGAGLQKSAKKK